MTARAFAQKTADGDGRRFLDKIGIGEETDIVDTPHVLLAKRKCSPALGILVTILFVGCSDISIRRGRSGFLSAREKAVERGGGRTVERFSWRGDFSEHLHLTIRCDAAEETRMHVRKGGPPRAGWSPLAARNEEVTAREISSRHDL